MMSSTRRAVLLAPICLLASIGPAVATGGTAGIPPEKLVLGVAFYGRGFAGVQPTHDGLNQPYERFEAAHPYAELVEKFIGRAGFVREWDARAQAPYLWNAQTRAFIFLTYLIS